MARNSSPTTELSENLEALELGHEKQNQIDTTLEITKSESDWQENSLKTDQSIHLYPADSENLLTKDYEWSNKLNHLDLTHDNRDPSYQTLCNCVCHYITTQDSKVTCQSCECHMMLFDQTQQASAPPVLLSCRQQALYNDVTVEELAGYLDELLYLPKPMSDMAELMYT